MKTVGIIGGIGPESTIDYYRKIIAAYYESDINGNYPKIIINSINMSEMLNSLGAGRLDDISESLVVEFEKLTAAGADFGVLASNTPHIVFDKVRESSALPLISIVEATCNKVNDAGLHRVALFGTKFTMNGKFYDQVFLKHNIQVFIPSAAHQDFIHEKYVEELVKGVVLDDTKSMLVKIALEMKKEHNIQGLVLGGTELSLILQHGDVPGIDIFDTTDAHVDSILEALR